MMAKITLALAIAFATIYAVPVTAAPGSQGGELAKHCIPQYDSSGVQKAPYCH